MRQGNLGTRYVKTVDVFDLDPRTKKVEKIMKARTLFPLLILLVLPCLGAESPEQRLRFETNGFSIAPLEGGSDSPGVVLQMHLRSDGGLAPNVNVVIQPYQGPLKPYVNLSKRQFKKAKWAVLHEEITETSATWEYAGIWQRRDVHFYARALLGDGKVYLITGSAPASQWKSVGPKIAACVDSFKIDKTKPKAGAAPKK
jgi:hypothetical protein